jgi:copper chaperone
MNTEEHRFHVPGISCGHCVASVVKALQAIGVRAEVEVQGGALAAFAPAGVDRAQIVAALTAAGYPPA